QRHLDLPRDIRGADQAKRSARTVSGGSTESGLIQEIEGFGAHLDVHVVANGQRKSLLHSRVDLVKGIPADDVASGAAKRLVFTRQDNVRSVEVIVDRTDVFGRHRIAENVRPQRHAAQEGSQAGGHRG